MRIFRVVPLLFLLPCLVAAGAVPVWAGVPPSTPSTSATPTLVDIRAAHHPGFDRIVFEFAGGLPSTRDAKYVDELLGDGSGLPVRIAGRAVLQVSFAPARAHDVQGTTAPRRVAFPLPNIMTAVRSGDFEAVTTYGIGLAKKTPFHVSTLQDPSRVVLDIRAAFPTVDRKVFFLNRDNFVDNVEPFFIPVLRPVRPNAPATGVMDRLFAGPLASERANGVQLLRSHAKGFADLVIADGVARVRLTGGCNSDGSTVSIAGEIVPTLKQFANVDRVKIFDPSGSTEVPNGHTDSIPSCLEP
jgi:hypothetical protein